MSDRPQTLQQAIVHFADKDVAQQYLVDLRWSDGVVCPHCKGTEHSYLTTRKIWKCKGCKKQFSVKMGTIFEDSPIGLDKWLPAIWMIANAKNGVSSCELARALGLTQKTAWFVLHRIRTAMQSGSIENYWSLFKRTLRGTYVTCTAPHLTRYLDEQTFRFNNRRGNDGTRFDPVQLCRCGLRGG